MSVSEAEDGEQVKFRARIHHIRSLGDVSSHLLVDMSTNIFS